MAGYYYCPLASALRPFLPASPWRNATQKDEITYRVGTPMEKGGKRQMEVMEYFQGKEFVSKEQLKRETALSSAVLKSLVEKGHLIEERRPADAIPPPASYPMIQSRPIGVVQTVSGDMQPWTTPTSWR